MDFFSFLPFFLLEKVKQLVKKMCQSCLNKEHWKIHLGEIRRKILDYANVALRSIAFRGIVLAITNTMVKANEAEFRYFGFPVRSELTLTSFGQEVSSYLVYFSYDFPEELSIL